MWKFLSTSSGSVTGWVCPGSRLVGGVDAGVDVDLVDVEADVGLGVGVAGVCVETAVGGSSVCGWVIVALWVGKGAR